MSILRLQQGFKYPLLALFLNSAICQSSNTSTEITGTNITPFADNLSVVFQGANNFLQTLSSNRNSSDFLYLSRSVVRNEASVSSSDYTWNFSDGENRSTATSSTSFYDGTTHTDERKEAAPTYKLTQDMCLKQSVTTFSGQGGVIYCYLNKVNWPTGVSPLCVFRTLVPVGRYVEATLDFTRRMTGFYLVASENPEFKQLIYSHNFTIFDRFFPLIMSGSNQIFFKMGMSTNITEFQLTFTANEEDLRMTLPVVYTSRTSGYVTTWGFENNRKYPCFMNASRTIPVPSNHVVLVSFSFVDIFYDATFSCRMVYIQVYEIESNGDLSNKMEICINSLQPALMLKRSVQVRFYSTICLGKGFKMIFSLHPVYEAPVRDVNGLWDCSVPYYNTFKQHLECNLEPECNRGEDEGPHCPFSSPACNGSVALNNKCYKLFLPIEFTTWPSASRTCIKRGGNVANMKTKEEWDILNTLYNFSRSPMSMQVGLLTYNGALPPQYKNVYTFSDGTVVYDYTYFSFSGLTLLSVNSYDMYCAIFYFSDLSLLMQSCAYQMRAGIPLCEFSLKNLAPKRSVLMPRVSSDLVTQANKSRYVTCAEGHFTIDFLSCDKASNCSEDKDLLHCQTLVENKSVLTAMFVCLDHTSNLHYSLVCDFKPDCLDGSDESFCKINPHCEGFKCNNGQCIELNQQCNVDRDCWDGSDEDCEVYQQWTLPLIYSVVPPAVIDFGLHYELVYKALNTSDPCPDTHFRCPPDGYCLPIYVRCNGVYDCPYHEDEVDCVSYTCPGFYRCRASIVCVHVDHMCDGQPQCPQHDDELFCELSCPQGCVCQGLAFVCSEVFDIVKYPDIRLLDASGSGMSTTDISPSIYLVWLSLAACNIKVLSNMSLPNLQTFDLSDNLITWLDMSYFMQFENLRVLCLSGNPLRSLFASSTAGHSTLTYLDISRTLLKAFEGEVLSSFSDIQVLNLSFGLLTKFSPECFKHSLNLVELDITGNEVKEIHSKTLRNLRSLRALHVSYYIFCCKEYLPDVENLLCFSPTNSFSSCQRLLQSKTLLVVIWILCVTSFVGNTCCAFYTIFAKKETFSSTLYSLMLNLNFSDLVMSVYLFVIGIVDEIYRDRYLWHEQSWTSGYVCQIAGLLYLVSTEVSVLTLFFMSMERLIAVRFSACVLMSRFLAVSCYCTWAFSFTVAAVPMTSQWDLYRQNSVCAPLPIYMNDFVGWPVELVVVALNLVLSIIADLFHAGSVCSLSVCIPGHMEQTKIGEVTLARRLTFLLFTKTLFCLLLSVIGVATYREASFPLDIISGLTLLICPLNASIDPIVYAVSIFLERRRKSQRQRLLKMLESRCQKFQKTQLFTCEDNIS